MSSRKNRKFIIDAPTEKHFSGHSELINLNNSITTEDFCTLSSDTGLKMYKIKLDVNDFNASELDVKLDLTKHCLCIKGLKNTRQFYHEVKLPLNTDIKLIRTYLIRQPMCNILSIEMPFLNSHQNRSMNGEVIGTKQHYGILKYKFNLKDYKPEDIQICIKDGKILVIYASTEVFDHYGKMTREFNREINLPNNVNPYKIKNFYNSLDGILHVEIPLAILADTHDTTNTSTTFIHEPSTIIDSTSTSTNYLEILFDLTGYDLDDVEVVTTSNTSKYLLKVKGVRSCYGELFDLNVDNEETEKNTTDVYYRQYVLPDWIEADNYQIFKRVRDPSKNIIVVKLPIKKDCE